MIVSINWLKKFTNINVSNDELATLIGARLVEIEDVIDLEQKYKDVVIAKVADCKKLEGSDHLNVTKLDDGGVVEGVERDENGYVQVVCGAPNVRTDMFVVWLPPRSVVPETFGEKEPFVLDTRNLRGVKSNGMIASAKELDLFDDHTGILEVFANSKPGARFVDIYELNDQLLDIENKSLTHRPDTFGIIGFAREVAGITDQRFKTPGWLKDTTLAIKNEVESSHNLSVAIDNAEMSARYQAILLAGADATKQSPLELQTYLARIGVRPINAVVDVTNYLMMLTGQPLHAFDYDKVVTVSGGKADIHVRAGREKETLELLDGRTIELTQEDIVIAAGDTPIGLAGAMGGKATEIDENTKTIILESATFNLYNLRATQMRHGIFSEAITRFTKGQPAELTAPVLGQAVKLIQEYTGAKVASSIVEAYPGKIDPVVVEVSVARVNEVLGTSYTDEEMVRTLENVEFDVSNKEDTLIVKVPYWRADIHIAEDIIEEIGRLKGFDMISPVLPQRDFTAVSPSDFDSLRSKVRKALVKAGANEVLTYSFVHGKILEYAGQSPTDSYRIVNSISPDLQYYRQTLTPSLLGLIHLNIKAGYDKFSVFELNKAHNKVHGMNDENVPGELNMLALTVTHKKAENSSPFYAAKKILQFLGSSLGLQLEYTSIPENPGYPVTAPFEYRRSAFVTEASSGVFLGIIGEYTTTVAKNFKLPDYTAGFEISSEALLAALQKKNLTYTPLSRYPSTERDICFQVAKDVMYGQIIASAKSALLDSGLEFTISPIDIYTADKSETKNITIRIKLTSHEKTLTGDEVSDVMETVTESVSNTTNAVVV